MKKLIITTLIAATLTGCASAPAYQSPTAGRDLSTLTPRELCLDIAQTRHVNDSARFLAALDRLNQLQAAGQTGNVTPEACKTIADMEERNIVASEQRQQAVANQNAAAWAAVGAAGQQMQQQQAVYDQQAQMQQQQAMQQAQHMQDQMAADMRNRQLINAINGTGF
ncbi:hypothetical protein DVA43_02435 [Leclercia sp. W6]|uniref:lipoprotein n=1 Tax=Leclercia sp. W6 TaxID=2282310 RepID=UPI000DF2B3FD|nr:lipoprotein [Leclercia sp. W6]AXF58492.1 hypothetical protein DVA43_02435 [Leclercia sp. W6]